MIWWILGGALIGAVLTIGFIIWLAAVGARELHTTPEDWKR